MLVFTGHVLVDDEVFPFLAELAGGDARYALNALESAVKLCLSSKPSSALLDVKDGKAHPCIYGLREGRKRTSLTTLSS